jgi:hypothetical protein
MTPAPSTVRDVSEPSIRGTCARRGCVSSGKKGADLQGALAAARKQRKVERVRTAGRALSAAR